MKKYFTITGLFLMLLTAVVIFTGCPDMRPKDPNEGKIYDVEAVTKDLDSAEIIYSAGDSKDSVTKDIKLETTGRNGSTITWVSSNEDVLKIDGETGTITRPAYDFSRGDVKVTITITVSRGSESKTKTSEITVKQLEPTESELIEAIKANIEDLIKYSVETDNKDSVTGNVIFETSYLGATITWESGNTANIAADGTVTRPAQGSSQVTVTLTATITINALTDTQTIDLVVKPEMTDEQAVDDIRDNLLTDASIIYADGDDKDNVTQNIGVPLSGNYGAAISWESNNPAIAITGSIGSVTQPAFDADADKDETVTLKATITKGVASAEKEFTLIVKEKEPTDEEAVAAVWEDFNAAIGKIGYESGDNASSVTQKLTLLTSVDNMFGTTISWSSDPTGFVGSDGTVTRPSYLDGEGNENSDVNITLSVVIQKNSAIYESGTIETVTVKRLPITDAEAVLLDKKTLDEAAITYASGDTKDSVTKSITLPTSGTNGTTITWSSNPEDFIAADGTLTRPTYDQEDQDVELTATISKGSESDTKIVVTVTVIKADMLDVDKVAEAIDDIEIRYTAGDSATSVTQKLTLPTTGLYSTSISWSSDPVGYVDANGNVTRPSFLLGDKNVELTATVTLNAASDSRLIETVKVIKAAITDNESVQEAKQDLIDNNAKITYATGDSVASVTQNITLTTSGLYGTTISWSSNKTSITPSGSTGIVERPAFDAYVNKDETVTLTATITKGSISDTTTFTLTVKEKEPNDDEAVAAVWEDFNAAIGKIGYEPGDNASSVTQKLTLLTSVDNMFGTTISWSSDPTGFVGSDGTVTRPSYLDGEGNENSDVNITLSVVIQKNSETHGPVTIETVTVKRLPITDAEAVFLDKKTLDEADITYASGDTKDSVTKSITLPTSGTNGTTITWSSNPEDFIAADGTLTRPTYDEGDQDVELTATISKGVESDTKLVVTVTLIKADMLDVDKVAEAIDDIAIGYTAGDSATSVTQKLTLPTTGLYSTSISWSSDPAGYVDANGNVTRPSFLLGDQDVELTATVTLNAASDSRLIETVKVIKAAITDNESVQEAKQDLIDNNAKITYASGDSEASVTQDITLTTSGLYGTTITWSSNKTSITPSGSTGIVERPAFDAYVNKDETVTLTATITKGSISDTTTFTLIVKELEPTDDEAVNAVADDVKVVYSGADYFGGQTIAGVTGNVTPLPSTGTGSYSTYISWATTNSGIVTNAGTVNRPIWDAARTSGYEQVELTATISKGGYSVQKTIIVQVTQQDATVVPAGTINGVIAPEADQTPVSGAITATSEYTGTVAWYESAVLFTGPNFERGKTYTAKISLTAKTGCSFNDTATTGWVVGTAACTFTKTSSTTATIDAVFPEVPNIVVDLFSIPLALPSYGQAPASTVDTTQYAGTVNWSPDDATFEGVEYTATISLTAKSGYTFAGVGVNSFSISGAPVGTTVINIAGSSKNITVTAAFPQTLIPNGYESGFTGTPEIGDVATLGLPEAGLTVNMIYTSNGEFTIPTGVGDDDTAVIDTKFWMAETEITNEIVAEVLQWAVDVGKFNHDDNYAYNYLPYASTTGIYYCDKILMKLDDTYNDINYSNGTFSVDADRKKFPVSNISWFGAVIICNWLTEMRDGNTNNVVYSGIPTAKVAWLYSDTTQDLTKNGYRLATANEWECAARYRGTDTTHTVTSTINDVNFGAMSTKWTKGDAASGALDHTGLLANIDPFAWYSINSDNRCKAVAQKTPNALGIYDMSGNIYEWTSEAKGCGGSFRDNYYFARIGVRVSLDLNTDNYFYKYGFRLTRTAD